MARRFFFSSLQTETNTFSNIPTTLESFAVRRGPGALDGPSAPDHILALARGLAEDGIELTGGLMAFAEPAGPTQQSAYETLRDEILDDLRRAAPVDAVLLTLHGAMVAQACDDCEGDLLERVRAVVGPETPVGAVLDPHAHLTQQMLDHASVLSFMKEYPHTDWAARNADVIRILKSMLDDGVRPTPATADCRLIGFFPTQLEPMRSFVDDMMAREREAGVVSLSFVHGFPWGDTAVTGARTLAYTDGDAAQAAGIAADLRHRIWAIKDQVLPPMTPIEDALRQMAVRRRQPLVVADFADNAGGGAPSDNTFILAAVLEAGLADVAIGLVFDPEAVRVCHEVGVGGRLDLRIGGKMGRTSGPPVDLEVEIMGLAQRATMPVLGLTRSPIGDTAWVRGAGVDIVLNSRRIQMYDPAGFSHLGIDPTAKSALVVKSSNHFAAAFAPIAERIIYVSGPGALDLDFARLPYRKLKSPYHPKVANPFDG